jgi:hypothetical protein
MKSEPARHRNNRRMPREFQIDKLNDEFGQ